MCFCCCCSRRWYAHSAEIRCVCSGATSVWCGIEMMMIAQRINQQRRRTERTESAVQIGGIRAMRNRQVGSVFVHAQRVRRCICIRSSLSVFCGFYHIKFMGNGVWCVLCSRWIYSLAGVKWWGVLDMQTHAHTHNKAKRPSFGCIYSRTWSMCFSNSKLSSNHGLTFCLSSCAFTHDARRGCIVRGFMLQTITTIACNHEHFEIHEAL